MRTDSIGHMIFIIFLYLFSRFRKGDVKSMSELALQFLVHPKNATEIAVIYELLLF